MDSAEVARRLARHRPGYELVSYREVALPLFRCELSAMVTEPKPIAPVQELVLRAIATGLRRHDEIARLLGLDEDVARAAGVQLMRDDDVALIENGTSSGKGHRLALTVKGRRSAAELVQSRLVETEMLRPIPSRARAYAGGATCKDGVAATGAKRRAPPGTGRPASVRLQFR